MKAWLSDAKVLVGGVIGGFVGGLAIATTWTFKPEKDAWDIVSSIGTASAVVVALWIALRDGLERRSQSRVMANIAKAAIYPKLLYSTAKLRRAHYLFEAYTRIDPNEKQLERALRNFKLARFQVPSHELAHLSFLGKDCEERIAYACSLMEEAVRLAEEAFPGLHLQGISPEQRKTTIIALRNMSGQSLKQLDTTLTHIRSITPSGIAGS